MTTRLGIPLVGAALLATASFACGVGASIGTVEYGDLSVSGEVEADYLKRQLYQLDPPFQACYVQAKRRDRTTEGVIRLSLRGVRGKLTGEITSQTTDNSGLEECVLNAIGGLRINEPDSGPPWNYTADWSVRFEIIRRDRSTN